jgi:hypothetical protein
LTITLPPGDIAVSLADSTNRRGTSIDGSFEVTVDKSASSALSRSVEPGTYYLEGMQGNRELTIEQLRFTPFGVVAIIQAQSLDSIYLSSFMFVDDRGNTAIPRFLGRLPGLKLTDPLYKETPQKHAFELVGLDPQAQSVSIIPFNDNVFDTGERRLVDLSRVGTQIALSDLGGVTVVSHEIERGTVTIKFKPYGYLSGIAVSGYPGLGGFYLQDTESLTLAEFPGGSRHSALVTSWYDRVNNLIVFIQNYYAATDEELAQTTTYEYTYNGSLSVDESATLTLPLS